MSLRVFHEPGAWVARDRLRLEAEESRYLLRVRRARPGAAVEVLDGAGAAWEARVAEIDGRTAVLELVAPRPAVEVMELELLLVVPEPRATLEALTAASELGATAVHLIVGEHSPGGVPSAERVARTLRASQRQCGRPRAPTMHRASSLGAALEASAARPGFVARVPQHHEPTAISFDPARGARLLVGPEGGLAPSEADLAEDAGLRPVALGPWVLRTPTAVAAGLARLQGARSASQRGPRTVSE